jgi:hypothetical protein
MNAPGICCFTLESNPGFPCRDFCATWKILFRFYGITRMAVSSMVPKNTEHGNKMEHFCQFPGNQSVGWKKERAIIQKRNNFVPKCMDMGTKPGIWEQFILPLAKCGIG